MSPFNRSRKTSKSSPKDNKKPNNWPKWSPIPIKKKVKNLNSKSNRNKKIRVCLFEFKNDFFVQR